MATTPGDSKAAVPEDTGPLRVRMSPDLKERYRAFAEAAGSDMSTLIQQFIGACVGGEPDVYVQRVREFTLLRTERKLDALLAICHVAKPTPLQQDIARNLPKAVLAELKEQLAKKRYRTPSTDESQTLQ